MLGEGDKHLLTPAREPMTDQLKDTTKVQLDGPVSFVKVICRNDSKTATSPEAHPRVYCVTKLFMGRQHTHLLTPNRDPTIDQSPVWWTTEFYWGSLQDCGSGVTYRSRHDDSEPAASPRPIPHRWHLTKTSKLVAHHTAYRLLNSTFVFSGFSIQECAFRIYNFIEVFTMSIIQYFINLPSLMLP